MVVRNTLDGDELRAEVDAVARAVEEVGVENVLCVITTTSCFAPRGADRCVCVCARCACGHAGMCTYMFTNHNKLHYYDSADDYLSGIV